MSEAEGDLAAAPRPPALAVGGDERRMHVRAYNHWVTLLHGRQLPAIADLDPAGIADFGPNSVLLDFTVGVDDPAVAYLGRKLRDECSLGGKVERISDVPPRSLLSRLTDHYLQIIANRAPVGYEAEFVNVSGHDTMYRGILMPFSSDGMAIDYVFGVINWKERVGDETQARLENEVAAALAAPVLAQAGPSVPAWADGPGAAFAAPAPSDIPTAERLAAARLSADAAAIALTEAEAALHRALGEAYDLSFAPDLATLGDGSPAQLVFGADHNPAFDAALARARAENVPQGTFAQYLSAAGGLAGLGVKG